MTHFGALELVFMLRIFDKIKQQKVFTPVSGNFFRSNIPVWLINTPQHEESLRINHWKNAHEKFKTNESVASFMGSLGC